MSSALRDLGVDWFTVVVARDDVERSNSAATVHALHAVLVDTETVHFAALSELFARFELDARINDSISESIAEYFSGLAA